MISRAKFRCNRLTTVQDIQDYVSLIFLGHSVVLNPTTRPKKLDRNARLACSHFQM